MIKAPTTAATVLVFLAAVAAGSVLLMDYGDDPFSTSLISDAMSYENWARRIAAEGIGAEPVFHQSPLFPLLMSLTYDDPPGPGVPAPLPWIQIFVTALAISMAVPLGRLYLGSVSAGVLAGVIALLHGPFLFHALKVLPVSLALATQALALVLLGLFRMRPAPWIALAAGVAAGVAAVSRAEFLLFVPVAALAVYLADGGRPRRSRILAAVLFAGGAAVAVAPVTAHNLRGGDPVLIASAGGENLFIGNQRGAEGSYKAIHPRAGDLFSARIFAEKLAEEDEGRDMKPSEISSYWRRRALDEIAADPTAWIALEARKLGRALSLGDPADMYSLPLERRYYLPTLWALPLPAGFVLGAGAIGLFLALRRRGGDAWPLAAFVAMHLAVLLAFFVSTRLRLPLLYGLVPFGALALVEIAAALRRRRGRWIAAVALAVLAAVSAVSLVRTVPSPRETVRLAATLSSRGDLDESLHVLEPAINGEDPYPYALDQAGFVLQKQERWVEAGRRYEQALRGDISEERRVGMLTRFAMVLEKQGRIGEAGAHHDRAVASPSSHAGTRYERGMFRMRTGDREGARADLEEALRLDPRYEAPRKALHSLR